MHFEVQNFCFFVPVQAWCALKSNTMWKTCTGTRKNKHFELQSSPNLHRDKKTKVLNFKVHQTCTGTRKNKKSKHFTIYLGRGDYSSKGFVFFLFFCPCAGLVHFEVPNFCFFVPVQVWCTLKIKMFVFFVPVQVSCTLNFKTQCMITCVLRYYFQCLQIIVPLVASLTSHAAF